MDRLKSAVAKLADQRVADSARAEDAARAREARIRELEEGLRASERLRTEAEVRKGRVCKRLSLFSLCLTTALEFHNGKSLLDCRFASDGHRFQGFPFIVFVFIVVLQWHHICSLDVFWMIWASCR